MAANSEPVRIVVEGMIDRIIISALLSKALPAIEPIILVASRSLRPLEGNSLGVRSYLSSHPEGTIVVFDQDEGTLTAALDAAPEYEGSDLHFCPAIPTVDAWLLADTNFAVEHLGLDEAQSGEHLFYGSFGAAQRQVKNVVRAKARQPDQLYKMIHEHFDIKQSMLVAPSLAKFIETVSSVGAITGPVYSRHREIARKLDNRIFASLIAEVRPAHSVVYRTADGRTYTAGELRNLVLAGDAVGVAYMESILRVARDILMFEADDDIEHDTDDVNQDISIDDDGDKDVK
jgi:hypothetical protein